ncbi:MAG: hemerythrin domain-containing protein [Fibrobacterales bacterium]
MKTYLEQYIKPLIEEYPEIGTILNNYSVGCTDCNVGTCKLIDILEIHNLDSATSTALINEMGKIIYGDTPFEIPVIEEKKAVNKESYSPAIRKMMNEHVYIKKVIAAIPHLVEELKVNFSETVPDIEKAIDFIRNYADGYHHAKEEDILFGFFDPELDILKVMYTDHDTGRNFVKNTITAIAEKNTQGIEEHLSGYAALLTEHIKKEDEILFPWMDRTLTDKQIGELYSQCVAVDATFGSKPLEYEDFASQMEKRFSHN